MELPIYENDVPVGTLRVSRQGLYTLFEARLPATPVGADALGGPQTRPVDRQRAVQGPAPTPPNSASRIPHSALPLPLTRLWLLDGAGAAAPLGLLEPGPTGRTLRRRLTGLDCRALPARPTRALALPALASPSGGGVAAACGGDGGACALTDTPFVSGGRNTPLTPPPEGEASRDDHWSSAPDPAPRFTAEQCSALRRHPPNSASPWISRPDGTLIDPARRLLALPCALRDAPPGLRLLRIGEREFLVFRY